MIVDDYNEDLKNSKGKKIRVRVRKVSKKSKSKKNKSIKGGVRRFPGNIIEYEEEAIDRAQRVRRVRWHDIYVEMLMDRNIIRMFSLSRNYI